MAESKRTPIRSTYQDMTGRTFGKWTVIEYSHLADSGKTMLRCRCECGVERSVAADSLRNGKSKSCGRCAPSRRSGLSHGGTYDSTYRSWVMMKQRCCNPGATGYHRYGGRGIQVCERWRDSFDAFLQDMGPRPSLGHSIDRIDNDGNYEPSNCRWATRKEQQNNLPCHQKKSTV